MSEYIDGVFSGIQKITDASKDISELSVNFARVGNLQTAEQLAEIAEVLLASSLEIRTAVSCELKRQVGTLDSAINCKRKEIEDDSN